MIGFSKETGLNFVVVLFLFFCFNFFFIALIIYRSVFYSYV